MFLVRPKGAGEHFLRLMSFKCNPWLGSDDAESEHDSHIPNIHFLGFNGLLETAPEVIEHPEAEARKK